MACGAWNFFRVLVPIESRFCVFRGWVFRVLGPTVLSLGFFRDFKVLRARCLQCFRFTRVQVSIGLRICRAQFF